MLFNGIKIDILIFFFVFFSFAKHYISFVNTSREEVERKEKNQLRFNFISNIWLNMNAKTDHLKCVTVGNQMVYIFFNSGNNNNKKKDLLLNYSNVWMFDEHSHNIIIYIEKGFSVLVLLLFLFLGQIRCMKFIFCKCKGKGKKNEKL